MLWAMTCSMGTTCPGSPTGIQRPRLTGTLSRAGGGSLPGVELRFEGDPPPGGSNKECVVMKVCTDDHGGFLVAGMNPGFWSVSARPASGVRVFLSKFMLSPLQSPPHPLDLKLFDTHSHCL